MSSKRTATLKDIAADAGIHVATASRALSRTHSHLVQEETRKRVLESAERLGYRVNSVARSLRSGKTGTIGVIVFDLANPFTATVLRGIDSVLEQTNQLSVVMETHNDPDRLRQAVQRLNENRVDAIIVAAAHTSDRTFLLETAATVPVILAVRRTGFSDDPDAPSGLPEALQDDVGGAAEAAQLFLDHGHRRIAQVEGDQRISSFLDRGLAFRNAVLSHGNADLIELGEHALDSTLDEGHRLAKKLLDVAENRRPTAVFAHNDMLAVGVLDALAEAGLNCPEDVSVIGYNDAPLIDHVTPPLTTVRLPAFDIGRNSAQMALATIDGEEPSPSRVMLPAEMVIRDSVAGL
ncbi:LacI family DNA-binding transcriptional regulator [uncultured Agrococcus sp.]|uniref:LacI family DNA-binding transcriptional regulator n=1 Tax=uncultured Agrococcus sp. TaxID=382258 RepID=UPI0025D77E00|nr:LacI family DNA-binding transcriptional regulator [uncultured Agrococcus sp.]